MGGPPQKEGDAAEQGGGGGGTEGQCTDLSQRLLFSGAVIPAEKGLRPVPDALDDEVDHADGVAHDRIAGHRQGAAVGQRSRLMTTSVTVFSMVRPKGDREVASRRRTVLRFRRKLTPRNTRFTRNR